MPQRAAESLEECFASEHAVGDVVGEQDTVGAHRAQVKEVVEARGAAHLRKVQAKLPGERPRMGSGSQSYAS